jgi:FkbM family methyltransferase
MHFPMWLRGYAAVPIRSIPIRIESGPLGGAKWSMAASPRRYRSGDYEAERFTTIQRLVHTGDVFWDVGAHFGYASLIAGRIVGANGAIVCVEPSAYNRWFLQKHLDWNGVKATVLPYAVGDVDNVQVSFGGERTSTTFRVGQGSSTVTVRTLPSLIVQYQLRPPTVIKMDIEGNESNALKAAADVLTPDMALLVSVHSYHDYQTCSDILVNRGFTVFEAHEIGKTRHVRDRNWAHDPDLLAFGSGRSWNRADFADYFVELGA